MTDQSAPRRCFVIMPFAEQLHFFYLALKYHIVMFGILRWLSDRGQAGSS
jgi:hypothetical protein